MKILNEFKQFALRGNVVDLAIGVVIGTSFGKIITSLVNDLIMPPLGLLINDIDFSKWHVELKAATLNAHGKVLEPAVNMGIGTFINAIVQFTIIAAVIFSLVKIMNRVIHKADAKAAPAAEVVLLTEIRDLLKQQSQAEKSP